MTTAKTLWRPAVRFTTLLLLLPAPSWADLAVVGGLTHEYTVEPGKNVAGSLDIRNAGAELVEAKTYQTDYRFFANGKNIYGKAGEDPRSNAKWIEFNQDFLSVPPGETVNVAYTIRVPTGTHEGTYWSMVMVEEAPPTPKPGAAHKTEIHLGIRHVMRYGVQIVTHWGATGSRKVKIIRKEVVKKDLKKLFEIDIENIGERWLVPEVWLELFDSQGARAGRFQGRTMRVFPGTSIRQSINLTEVHPGHYKGMIVIDDGDENIFGARTELDL